MDYSKLSDFEINKLVAAATGARVSESISFVNTGEGITGHYQEPVLLREVTTNRRHWKAYDPCNNPADAWPIIHQNEINILWNWNEEGLHGATALPLYEYEHENALRAAMTVFLKIQGRANVQDNPA